MARLRVALLGVLLGLRLGAPVALAQEAASPAATPPTTPPAADTAPAAAADTAPAAAADTAPAPDSAPDPAPAPAPAPASGAAQVPPAGEAPAPATVQATAAESAPDAAPAPADSSAADPKNPETFPQPPLEAGVEKRETPDLDGRPDKPADAGDVLLWVPRVAFFPLYLVSEYVVRIPLGALVTAAEKGNWLAIMSDFFTFDEEQKTGIVPTAYLEFDFQPSVGLYFFADDAFVDRNDIRIIGAMWPDDWWSLTVLDRVSSADDDLRFALRGSLLIRPDYQFHGLGPDSLDADEARYASDRYDLAASFDGLPWRASAVHWETGLRKHDFDANTRFDQPDLEAAVADPDNAITELPPGFDEGYTIYRNALSIALDTRKPFPESASGVRLELRGEHAFDLEDPLQRRWVRYGGALGGFLDILHHRVISLSFDVELSESLAGEIPFTELPTIGGAPPMLGFQEGRLFGNSRTSATFEYRWPVWIWADFALHYGVGNVFGQDLEGFELDRLRSSFGLGLRAARMTRPDHSINFLVAFGTETFEQGHGIDTVRIAVGGTVGF